MNCPDCGAPLRLESDKDYFVCDYCGNVHVPQPSPDGVCVLAEGSDAQCPICAIGLMHAAIDRQRILYCSRCHGMLIPMDIFAAVIDDLRSRRKVGAEIVKPLNTADLDRVVR